MMEILLVQAALTACSVEPLDRDWSYRTMVEGRPDKCWYQGERMRPRERLYWPRPQEPEWIAPQRSEFDERWRDLMIDLVPSDMLNPEPAPKWRGKLKGGK